MEKVLVGIITKPQALKGEFRVKPEILNIKQFKKFEKVTIKNKDYNVEKVTLRDSFVILKVEGVDRCEDAELMRNSEVFAEMEVDTEDSFDLVGFNVIVSNETMGTIVDINNYGSKDIVSAKANNSFMFPIIDDLIIEINESSKSVILDAELFNQVVVYEN